MANLPLYLTASERTLFDALSSDLKGDYAVEEETGSFTDSPEKMAIRMRNITLSDPKLLALKDKAAGMKTAEDFQKLSDSVDFAEVAEDDLMELYFALGPEFVTIVITETLKNAKTSDDVGAVASFSIIRHGLLLSLSSSPARA